MANTPESKTVTDGTFDNVMTMTRQVFVNGIMAFNIHAALIPLMRDTRGNKIDMLKFGHFPDLNG